MILTPELVADAKKNIDLPQYFTAGEATVAQHILYKQFKENTKWENIPKIIFYLLLQEHYGGPVNKDANGDLGYNLKIIIQPC